MERALEVHLGIFPFKYLSFYKQAAAITLHVRINVFPRKHIAINYTRRLIFSERKLHDFKCVLCVFGGGGGVLGSLLIYSL